nr:uncharacterized protein LOC126538461 [Dermacentor andersoni]
MDKATFNEALITEVEKRRVLWDVRDRNYKNNMKRDQAWRATADALSVDVTQVMKRWKSLRDTFMKKRKEVTTTKSGAGADSVFSVRWPHYNQLLFLLDTMEYPETSGNLVDIQDIDSFDETSTAYLQTERTGIIDIEANLVASNFPTSPGQEDGSGCSSPTSAPSPASSASSGPQKRKRGHDKVFEKEIGILGEWASKRADASELFGLFIGDKHRRVPQHLRGQFELELLQVAARYVDNQ